jgi:cytochrome d ubiquinol oxidase subunit II
MLETIWFVLWGLLWAIYFMLDGFDLGLGALMPFLAKKEEERRIVYSSMGPFWDGNEVWLITAGGVTFAAFPKTYAVLFSSLYSALMLLLFSLIFRAVSIEFRGKRESPRWRAVWDTCLTVVSFSAALLLGVAFANIFKGIPIDAEGVYQGTLFTLLNPYGLLGGLFFLMLFLVHGALWQAIKAAGPLQERAGRMAVRLWPVLLAVAVVFLVATAFATRLYDNYLSRPLLLVIPLAAVAGLFGSRFFMGMGAWWRAWFASCLAIAASTLFGVIGLYPNLLPSTLDPAFSLTVANSASTPLTLKIMLAVALTFVPIVVLYQGWVYHMFRGKVTEKDLAYEEGH